MEYFSNKLLDYKIFSLKNIRGFSFWENIRINIRYLFCYYANLLDIHSLNLRIYLSINQYFNESICKFERKLFFIQKLVSTN